MTTSTTRQSRIGFVTLGCAKNTADTENMLGLLHAAGYQITNSVGSADVCVVNTCTFIAQSTAESLDALIELNDAGKRLVVAGCLAQRYKEQIFAEIPQVKAILGTGDIAKVVQAVQWAHREDEPKSFIGQNGAGYIAKADTPRIKLCGGHSAYVKIAEGCNHKCSFCIIPNLRGKLKSRSIEDICTEAHTLVAEGVKEIVLISQDSTAYGIDLYKGQWMLAKLLHKLASETNIPWLRLMYAYPREVSDELLQTMAAHNNIVPYIDIPLQHSHPEMLTKMNRPLNPELTIQRIRNYIPAATIRSTLIVGHPGESDEHFEHLEKFLEVQRLDHVGIFTYSQEDTTPSATFGDQVPEEIKVSRRDRLMKLQRDISHQKNLAKVGRVSTVLIEQMKDNLLIGRSQGDAPGIDGKVIVVEDMHNRPPESLLGEIVSANIIDASAYDLMAKLI